MPPLLQIKNLSLALSGKTILSDISFSLKAGNWLSIIGPNGAGKSTLIKCLSQIHSHWAGSIQLDGQDLRTFSSREQARRISYVPQAEGRSLPFSVYEFILMGRYPHLSPFTAISSEDKALVHELLQQIAMEAFADRKLSTLSGGERQMVFIAAALAQQAEIILLDEPTAFLDYRHKAQVDTLLHTLNTDHQKTIITVSHDLNNACQTSSHILALKQGSIHYHGTPDHLLNEKSLKSLYETPFQIVSLPNNQRLALQTTDIRTG